MTTDYICNPENMELRLQKHMSKIQEADLVLVFSCGVGVQTISEYLEDKMVCAACDTYPVPGFQGVTPLEYKCDQCRAFQQIKASNLFQASVNTLPSTLHFAVHFAFSILGTAALTIHKALGTWSCVFRNI